MNSKQKRIEEEEKRLNIYFDKLPKNQLEVARGLIQNCAFMKVILEDLQKEIEEDGSTEVYIHGANQKGIKASASLQAYQGTMKIYTNAIHKLIGLLPRYQEENFVNDLKVELERITGAEE